VQVGKETTPVPVVGVRHVVARHGALSCDLADLWHDRYRGL